MIVKHFGCTAIYIKALYKCIIHLLIHSFIYSIVRRFLSSKLINLNVNNITDLTHFRVLAILRS